MTVPSFGESRRTWPRRSMLGFLAAAGAGAAFSRALLAQAENRPEVTAEMIRNAEWVSGMSFDDAETEQMLEGMNDILGSFARIRDVALDNNVAPALDFRPGGPSIAGGARATPSDPVPTPLPKDDVDVAFAPVSRMSAWIRGRRISSVELTELYLERLRRHDPELECVITLTEERAMRLARRADEELARGYYRGPLHGIPWGAKDLLAVPGYRTTWGAKPYAKRELEQTATVVGKLDEAGAVLVAKLTLGALAWGDVWYGGMTRNPWKPEQGSSGSSAGPGSATAAGLVGFSIGSETWGSIVSPCSRCGVTGLRPTFGRVSRHGAMALSWSMDKLGPMTRSVEDCALVFAAIQGADGLDRSVVERPFEWPSSRALSSLRVGYVKSQFEKDRGAEIEDEGERKRAAEWQAIDLRTLETLRSMGMELVPIELPDAYPVGALSFILSAEAAAAFDELTRSGRDAELVRQVAQAWPNVLRQAQMIPAVEYIRANRIRSLVLAELEQTLDAVDVYVCPSYEGDNLLMTNLTGHPCVVLPNGFRESDGTPTSITFNGRLHGEAELLAVAHAYQQATGHHLKRPPVGSRE